MFKECLEKVQNGGPLIHAITNYVTVNDCANMLLAAGASPIMADDIGEAADITAICTGLCINIGTLNAQTIPSMKAAGEKANVLGYPVVLDPVGAGASRLRTETAKHLLDTVQFTAIRGNISEIKTLSIGQGTTLGVDAAAADAVTEDNLAETLAFAKDFAKRMKAVVVITGAMDLITDGEKAFCIRNGHPYMKRITGTGCQLSVLLTAYLAANPKEPLLAAVSATAAMGVCGEQAFRRLGALDGNASYRNYIIDAMCHLTGETLEQEARYEVL